MATEMTFPMTDVHTDAIEHEGIKGMKWFVRRFQNKDGSLTPEGRKRYGVGEPREPKADSDTGLGVKRQSKKKGIGLPLAAGMTAALGVSTYNATKAALGNDNPEDKSDNGNGGKKDKGGKGNKNQKVNVDKETRNILEGLRQYRNAGSNNDNNNQNQNRYNTRKTLSQSEMDAMSDQDLQKLVSRMNLETSYSRLTQEPAQVDRVDAGLQRAQAILTVVGSSVTIAAASAKLYKTLRK